MSARYELKCKPTLMAEYDNQFESLDKAIEQAKHLSSTYQIEVRVVRVLGICVPESRWVPTEE